eukprot:SAG11_NODE_8671_length_988_cov_6.010124_1_plen_112_part_00
MFYQNYPIKNLVLNSVQYHDTYGGAGYPGAKFSLPGYGLSTNRLFYVFHWKNVQNLFFDIFFSKTESRRNFSVCIQILDNLTKVLLHVWYTFYHTKPACLGHNNKIILLSP